VSRRDSETYGRETRSYPAAVQAEGVPVTKMTGMMKIMTGFNPKSITQMQNLQNFRDYYEILGAQRATNEEIKQVFRRLSASIIRSQRETNRQRRNLRILARLTFL